MEVKITLAGVDQVMNKYKPPQIAKAIKNALNRAVRSGKTEASDRIRNDLGMNVKKADLDRKITVTYATTGQTEASITVSGSPILLSYFGARQGTSMVAVNKGEGVGRYGMASTIKGRGTKGGRVQVEIIKGKRTLLDDKTFIARGRHGLPMVFRRTASGKLIGKKVYAHHSMLKKPVVLQGVKRKIMNQWAKEWDNQLAQLSKGAL